MLTWQKRIVHTLWLVPLCLVLTGADYLGQKRIEQSRSLLGTTFTITIFEGGANLERNAYLVGKAFELIQSLEDKMYSQNEKSVVWKLNHEAPRSLPLDEDSYFVIEECLRLSRISDGYFDITDAPLRALWAEAKDKGQPPPPEAIQKTLALVDYRNLALDASSKTLRLQKEGTEISIDEPAQGYAADKALLYLKSQGVTSAMIKTGENVRWIGLSQEGRYWRFGIDHPRNVDQYAAVLEMENERAISSTGDYEDFFLYKGTRYPLVINPKTGYPPMNGVAGVTVTAENAAFANLLSHLFFIYGPEKGYDFAEHNKEEGIEAVFIEEDKSGRLVLTSSEGLHNSLKDIQL